MYSPDVENHWKYRHDLYSYEDVLTNPPTCELLTAGKFVNKPEKKAIASAGALPEKTSWRLSMKTR